MISLHNRLFYPGLYLSEDEFLIFSVEMDKIQIKDLTWETYCDLMEEKLHRMIENNFQMILAEYEEDYVISQIFWHRNKTMTEVFEEQFSKLTKQLTNALDNQWDMPGLVSIWMKTEDPKTLVSQLVEFEDFRSELHVFYDRVKAIQNNESLTDLYLEKGFIVNETDYEEGILTELGDELIESEYHQNFIDFSYLIRQ